MLSRDILIWLNSINGVGNKTIDILINHVGNIKDIWNLSNNEIYSIKGINKKVKNSIIKSKTEKYICNLMNKIIKLDIKVLTIIDKEYPSRLKNIFNSPKVLYIKGDLKEQDKLCIAIVGSRKATFYGKWAAEKISKELAQSGVTVISGMARGIDTKAHYGALASKGRTIAVLGSGIDIIYPKSNTGLFEDIKNNGCIITEYPPGMKPVSHNFPQRNRIISGLSLGVLVVEATKKSGSLITVSHALEQGKEVFALPGNINSIYSKGTNALIKDGAKLVTNTNDILEEIIELKDSFIETDENKIDIEKLTSDEKKVIKTIIEGPIHIDMISYNTNISISKLNSILTVLEMKSLIKQIPGNVFIINS